MKALVLLFLIGLSPLHAEFKVPPLQSAVTDLSGTLNPSFVSQMNGALADLAQQTSTQFAVLVVPDLDGTPIENASIQVTDKWKLGKGHSDRGLLLLIATQERRMRIEVGQGLEGEIPDAIAKRVIADVITPEFKQGSMEKGIYFGLQALLARAEPDFNFQNYFNGGAPTRKNVRSRGETPPGWVLILVVLSVLIAMLGGGRRGRRGFYGGMGGFGGGFGGGGFGSGSGGGFSGGGGGFSGGGASGNW